MQFKTIPLAQRQDIFLKLVTLQDARTKGIRECKKSIIEEFQIDDATLEKITEEGMDRNWPPLSDEDQADQNFERLEESSKDSQINPDETSNNLES
jgi:hypothetical protein